MMIEHRYVLSLDEIKALRFRCKKCHAATSFPLDESINFPPTCPNCRETLFDTLRDSGESALLQTLPRVLKGLVKTKQSGEVLLEIDVPREK